MTKAKMLSSKKPGNCGTPAFNVELQTADMILGTQGSPGNIRLPSRIKSFGLHSTNAFCFN